MSAVRSLAWKIAPERMADRAVLWNEHVREENGITKEGRRYASEHGMTVTGGPFAGLRYPEESVEQVDALVAKLSGKYEAELHPIISEALERQPSSFVDIGTADGYYAVGFALRSGMRTQGFEIAPRARRLATGVADLNGVNVTLQGAATSRSLRALDLDGAFVLADCEGAETEIFDVAAVAALGRTFVVIEMHEWARAGVEKLLVGRFSPSHKVQIVSGSSPEPLRLDEGRWAICRPTSLWDEAT
jgi:hypothetical protein